MTTLSLAAVLLLSLPFLLKGESYVPSTFTCTATPPQYTDNTKCDNNVYNGSMSEELVKELIESTRANTKSISQLRMAFHAKSRTSEAVLNDLLLFVEELVTMHNVSTTASSPLPKSCQEIKQRMSTSPSGVYLIANNEKKTEYVYCQMGTLCGSDGGWTRLAHLDMTDPTESCPNGWRLYEVDGVRACGRASYEDGSCSSVQYPSNGVRYTEICGRARGYQYATSDAVDSRGTGHNDINSHYVDGLSLTRGNPRKHVWTYMAGAKEDNSYGLGQFSCPCQPGSQQSNNVPNLIGNDYYCESGNPAIPSGGYAYKLYTADPLWDGEQCNGLESPCCTSTTLPWFHKVLDSPTNDYIEARVCADQSTDNEDAPIEIIEVFVK